ncbi:MAG: ribosomal protein S18-alanine N-acetyltransferase [Fimbriimonadales bacterium]
MVRFVPLEEAHLPAILEIEAEANTSPWSERSFRNELVNPQSIFRVVLSDGAVAGFGSVWLCIDEAHITNIAIAKNFRRKGIGRKLMVELLTLAREAGMGCSTLEVRASNLPAIALYERLGYVQASIRRGYYPDNHEDAVIMWLYDLKSWTP